MICHGIFHSEENCSLPLKKRKKKRKENCSQSIACDVTISCFFQAFNQFLIYGMLVKDLDTSSGSHITSQGKRMQCHLAFTINVNPVTHKKIN